MSDKPQLVDSNLMSATSDKLKFVKHRVPLVSKEPTTLVELYERVATEHPKSNTLNYKRDGAWHSLSAAEMLRRARHVALGLNALGIRKGDRVAIISESCLEWVIADQGCILAGAITVPIYPTLTAEQARYIINDCEARAIFVATQQKLKEIDAALKECPTIETVILFESPTPPRRADVLSFDQLQERGQALGESDPALIKELAAACRPEDLATIIYTSGTTGEPKGVMLTHANMVSNLVDSSNHLEFGEADCALSVLPLSHSFKRQAMNMYLHHGMSVYFVSLETLGENLREVHPTVFVGVPRIYEKIIQRVEGRAAEKGAWNAAIVTWAIEVTREWARRKSSRRRTSPWLWLKHKLGDILVYEKLRKAMGGRIRILVSGGAALADDVALAFLEIGRAHV